MEPGETERIAKTVSSAPDLETALDQLLTGARRPLLRRVFAPDVLHCPRGATDADEHADERASPARGDERATADRGSVRDPAEAGGEREARRNVGGTKAPG